MASEQGCLSSFKRQSKNPKALLPKPTQHNTDVTSATARQFPLSESKSTLSSPPCLWGVYSQRPLITYCFDPPHPPVSIPEHFMRYSNFSFWLVTITPSEFLLSTVCSHRRCLQFYGLIKCKQSQSFNRVTHKHTYAQGRISALIATFCWNWHLTKLTLFQTAFSLILTKK